MGQGHIIIPGHCRCTATRSQELPATINGKARREWIPARTLDGETETVGTWEMREKKSWQNIGNMLFEPTGAEG